MPIFPPANRRCAIASASISASRCRWSAIWGRPAWSRRSRRAARSRPGAGRGRLRRARVGGRRSRVAERRRSSPGCRLSNASDHPAGLPVFAIARPHPDAIVKDVEMWSVRVAGWGVRPAQALASLAEAVAVPDRGFDGAALLVPVPRGQNARRNRRTRWSGRRVGAQPGSRRQPRQALYGRRRCRGDCQSRSAIREPSL